MGVSLSQLRRRSPKYDPDESNKVQAAWITWMEQYGNNGAEGADGEVIPWEVAGGVGPEDKMEEDLSKAIDMLDKVHLILVDVHKLKTGRKLRSRVNEMLGELGEFLQDLYSDHQEAVH